MAKEIAAFKAFRAEVSRHISEFMFNHFIFGYCNMNYFQLLRKADLQLIQYIIAYNTLKPSMFEFVLFSAACNNKYDIIQYLTSPEFNDVLPMYAVWNVALKNAAKRGHMEAVKIIMFHTLCYDKAFVAASKYGQLKVMRFMVLTDPDVILFNNNLKDALSKFTPDSECHYKYALEYVNNLKKIANKIHETYDYFNNITNEIWDQARALVIREHSLIYGNLDIDSVEPHPDPSDNNQTHVI